MTTIAWDGKTLVADTLSVCGGLPKKVTKIRKLKDGSLFGASGDMQDCIAVGNWLSDSRYNDKPKVDESFNALIIETDSEGLCHVYKLEDKLIRIPVHETKVAIGSGKDFALAAMRLGCSASSAIVIAAEFDVFTGDIFDVLTFD